MVLSFSSFSTISFKLLGVRTVSSLPMKIYLPLLFLMPRLTALAKPRFSFDFKTLIQGNFFFTSDVALPLALSMMMVSILELR